MGDPANMAGINDDDKKTELVEGKAADSSEEPSIASSFPGGTGNSLQFVFPGLGIPSCSLGSQSFARETPECPWGKGR